MELPHILHGIFADQFDCLTEFIIRALANRLQNKKIIFDCSNLCFGHFSLLAHEKWACLSVIICDSFLIVVAVVCVHHNVRFEFHIVTVLCYIPVNTLLPVNPGISIRLSLTLIREQFCFYVSATSCHVQHIFFHVQLLAVFFTAL